MSNRDSPGWRERLKSSPLLAKLKSKDGILLIGLGVAMIVIMVYLASSLNSCTSSTPQWSASLTGGDEDLGAILSQIEGAGTTEVLITRDKSGALVGVVVVSEGAGNQQVAVRLLRAVQTATGATLDQINIFQRKT
ncbi:MAG: hypothetical protein IJX70_02015 [Clostridia bacterium]|nr:hypothetical protein [Clostridia bacterium]